MRYEIYSIDTVIGCRCRSVGQGVESACCQWYVITNTDACVNKLRRTRDKDSEVELFLLLRGDLSMATSNNK